MGELTPALPVEQRSAQPPAHPGANGKAPETDRSGRESAGRRASPPAQGQSRLLKGASPLQSRPRRPAGEARWSLARCLTERDRAIMRALARHRVFTREQLGEMFFDSQHRARVRLVALHRHQVLDRFQPHRPGWGAAGFHYVLGPMGAAIVAADVEAGEDPDRAARRWRAERTLALGRPQRLAHLVGVNGFYTALVGHARATPGAAEVVDWLTEAEATRWADAIVRPDAYGSWRHDGDAVEFFVEWDRGTETLGRLVAKLGGYERFESERGASAWVVFAFPSPRRESAAWRALAGATSRWPRRSSAPAQDRTTPCGSPSRATGPDESGSLPCPASRCHRRPRLGPGQAASGPGASIVPGRPTTRGRMAGSEQPAGACSDVGAASVAKRRRRRPPAPDPGTLAALARALVDLAVEVHGDGLKSSVEVGCAGRPGERARRGAA